VFKQHGSIVEGSRPNEQPHTEYLHQTAIQLTFVLKKWPVFVYVCKGRYLAFALQPSWETAKRGNSGLCQRTDSLHKSGTGPAEAAPVWTADLIEGCLRRLLG